MRPKRVVANVKKAWCQACADINEHARTLNPAKVIEKLRSCVGDGYIDADLENVDYSVALLAAPGDIFLHGGVGVGKTWAMAALLKEFLCRGLECKRVNFDEFCCRVRATMNSNSKITEYDLIKSLVDVDRLFIDDVGLRSKKETDFAYITFYSILNKRQERRLPTYITTNKTIDQLAQSFDQRIASRLRFATVIEMTGEDRRAKEPF